MRVRIKSIKLSKNPIRTWDLEVEKYHNYFLDSGIISHNSSKPSSATPGIEPPRELVTIKNEKSTTVKQLVPFYKSSSKYYTTAWGQDFNNKDYNKLISVVQQYVDQSISSNQYYDTRNSDGKVKLEQIIEEFVQCFNLGIKALYYANFRSSDDADGEIDENLKCAGGGCSV